MTYSCLIQLVVDKQLNRCFFLLLHKLFHSHTKSTFCQQRQLARLKKKQSFWHQFIIAKTFKHRELIPFLVLCIFLYCNSFEDQAPVDEFFGTWPSNELQWLYLKIGKVVPIMAAWLTCPIAPTYGSGHRGAAVLLSDFAADVTGELWFTGCAASPPRTKSTRRFYWRGCS